MEEFWTWAGIVGWTTTIGGAIQAFLGLSKLVYTVGLLEGAGAETTTQCPTFYFLSIPK
ncbi:MAG: hypothetical protein ACPLRZ_07220 [Thermovenabulum sp.]|uniref:hypothetical protein n=1 Tax=Thermovenabulum sp. TaxID=3100335 RepID=UPI003C7D1175